MEILERPNDTRPDVLVGCAWWNVDESLLENSTYTDKNNSEIGRKYNVSDPYIYYLRTGHIHSNLACEYINSKGLDEYWQGYRHTK